MSLSQIDYGVIIIFLLLIFSVRFFVGANREKNLDNYFFAGRKLTLPFFTASLVSTWYGNILGVGEIAYKYGLVNWLSQGLFWYLIYFFFAFFLVPKIHDSKLLSIPDQIENYYGKKSALASALVNTLLQTPAGYILSLGLVISMIFNLDITIATILSACVPLVYVARGAFKAVVYADFIQFCFMFLGLFVVLPFAVYKYGGWNFLTSNIPKSHLSLIGDWNWQMILAWFLIACWTLVSPSFYQLTYAAKNNQTAKNGILLAMFFWLIFDLLITFTGIYAYAAMPNLDPKFSLAIFADNTLPVFFKGIFFAGLIATILSTLDSLLFSSSMSLSYDFFGRAFNLSSEQIIKTNRWVLFINIVVSLIIALVFNSLFKIIYLRGSLAISSLLIPLLMALLMPKYRASSKQVYLSIIISFFATLFWFVAQESGLNFIKEIEPIFIGLICSGVLNFCKLSREH